MNKNFETLKEELVQLYNWAKEREPLDNMSITELAKPDFALNLTLHYLTYVIVTSKTEIVVNWFSIKNILDVDMDDIVYIAKEDLDDEYHFADSERGVLPFDDKYRAKRYVDAKLEKLDEGLTDFTFNGENRWSFDIPTVDVEEENRKLLGDMTPMEYCRKIVEYTCNQLRKILVDKEEDGYKNLNVLDFFCNRQCDIYLKNGTYFQWTIETPISDIFIPDLDDIVYIHFDCVPCIRDSEFSEYGIDEFIYENSQKYHLDSIKGIFHQQDDEHISQHINRDEYRMIGREFLDVSNQWRGSEKVWWLKFEDAEVGAFVAEEVLMSNPEGVKSISYGKEDYESQFDSNSRWELIKQLFNLDFRKLDEFDCDDDSRVQTLFIYAHLASLLDYADVLNFSRTKLIMEEYFKTHESLRKYEDDVLDYCNFDYINFDTTKHYDLIHIIILILAQTSSYKAALEAFLEAINWHKEKQTATIIFGLYAGVYFQHYNIPLELVKSNRFADKYKDKILSFDDPSYTEKASGDNMKWYMSVE